MEGNQERKGNKSKQRGTGDEVRRGGKTRLREIWERG